MMRRLRWAGWIPARNGRGPDGRRPAGTSAIPRAEAPGTHGAHKIAPFRDSRHPLQEVPRGR